MKTKQKRYTPMGDFVRKHCLHPNDVNGCAGCEYYDLVKVCTHPEFPKEKDGDND